MGAYARPSTAMAFLISVSALATKGGANLASVALTVEQSTVIFTTGDVTLKNALVVEDRCLAATVLMCLLRSNIHTFYPKSLCSL